MRFASIHKSCLVNNSYLLSSKYAPVAQWIERPVSTRQVVGSSPARSAIILHRRAT